MIRLQHQKLRGLRALRPYRHNPPTPETPVGMPEDVWKQKIADGTDFARTFLLRVREELLKAGVPADIVPLAVNLNKHAKVVGLSLASQPYPELAINSRLSTPAEKVADMLLVRKGLFREADETPTGRVVLDAASAELASTLTELRKEAEARIASKNAAVQASKEDEEKARRLAEIDAQIAALTSALGGAAPTGGDDEGEDEDEDEDEEEGEEDFDEIYSQVAEAVRELKKAKQPVPREMTAFLKAYKDGDEDKLRQLLNSVIGAAGGEPSPEPPKAQRVPRGSQTAATPRRTTTTPRRTAAPPPPDDDGEDDGALVPMTPARAMYARLTGNFEAARTPMRRTTKDETYVPPSAALLKEAKDDVLIYALGDGTAQVWAKGSLTETFQSPGRGKSGWQVAVQYAKNWTQLKESRRNARILVSSDADPNVFEVAVEAQAGRTAPAGKAPTAAAMAEQIRRQFRSNPRVRQVAYRNPHMRRLVAEVQKAFPKRNPGIGYAIAAAAGFVGGTYAEAAYGLSKHFTRGGQATYSVARTVARGEMPKLPQSKRAAQFEPSARLAKMIRDYYAVEDEKKRTPFAQAAKREALEDRLDAMWAEIQALEAKERAGVRSNPSGRVTVVTRRPGDGGYPETYYFDTLADAAAYAQKHRKTTITRITRDNEDVYEEVMAMAFGRSNPRKQRVPDHIAKTPRSAGTSISAIGVKGRWPIGDLFHARLAAVYIKSPSHAAHRAKVLRALETYYPQYDWREFLARPVEAGMRRAVANPGWYF